MRYVPVLDSNNKPLMPTTIRRSMNLIDKSRAIYFWKNGIFCIKMLDRDSGIKQEIAVGVDPGSKREGYTIKSNKHTYLNIQSKAVDWVKEKVAERAMIRRNRRNRKCPRRECRANKLVNTNRLPPSTRARWNAKLRVLNFLDKIFPISVVVVEDIAAMTKKGMKKWNISFSPLEVGKKWFYEQIRSKWHLELRRGWETKMIRDVLNLKKSSNKLAENWNAHCVDSWCLAFDVVGGTKINRDMLLLNPLNKNKRKLHHQVPIKGARKSYNTPTDILKGALVRFRDRLFLANGNGVGRNGIRLVHMDNKQARRSVVSWKLQVINEYNKWGFSYA
jgi:hypothetical protein